MKAFQELLDAVPQVLFEQWIRIGMDTGGIAAGADRLWDVFEKECAVTGVEAVLQRTGTCGYAYLDPLVELKSSGHAPVLYGCVDEPLAVRIVREHLLGGRLIDDFVVAPRRRSKDLGEADNIVLVKDSSCEGEDRTATAQSLLLKALRHHGLQDRVQVVRALDMGIYKEGLVVQLLPSGVTYTNVLNRDLERIVEQSIRDRAIVEDLLFNEPDPQTRIVLRNCGSIDPECLDDALRHGAYAGFARALGQGSPGQTIDCIRESGLRGRGGAGFPTGTKWKLTRDVEADLRYVICNADEGDPGAFMDRSILEGDPHSVLEGLMTAAYAIGAGKGYFYIRAEYPLAVKRVELAIAAARKRGLLGKNILGSGWDFEVEVRLGAGAFVCGEETALIASIEGKRGSPHPRPPYPSVKGLWGKPTCINNVETLASVPWILTNGAKAYESLGSGNSRGTKVFAVTGKVRNPQLVEVPMGTTVSDIIYKVCGGVQDDVPIKGVQTGGPSGGILPEKHLETPITYENLQKLGSIMGSGGMLVMDENDCMVDVSAFYLKFCVDESCGKCAPCRVGGYQMLQLLLKISRGRGSEDDLVQIDRICEAMQSASLCGLGQTAPNPVLSSLRFFRDEYSAYIEGGTSYARKRKKALSEGKSMKEAV
ncbi:MAG: SLBB domain-containing protein [Opitutales bacterium]|nr:SLBB domain-containing protein [Opitutales bacterium]